MVIDIGAGTGAITFPLAEKAGTVIAIENIPASIQKLRRKINEENNIKIKQIDVLRYELPRSPFYVVANIFGSFEPSHRVIFHHRRVLIRPL